MLSYRSYVLGYGVGPIEERTGDEKLARFIRGHCASAMRLKAMALTAYEKVGTLTMLPQSFAVGTVLYTCLTAAISSLDSLGCVLSGLLSGKPGQSHHPDMRTLSNWAKKNSSPSISRHVQELLNSNWFKDLKLARDSLVHRGYWPSITKDGRLVFAPRPGIFSKDFGEHDERGAGQLDEDEIIKIDLANAMLGLLVGLEEWEKSIQDDLANASRFESFMSNGLLITACIDEQHLLSDPFLMEQFFKTGTTEYREWFHQQKARSKKIL